MTTLTFLLTAIVLMLVAPVVVYSLEVLAGCWPGRKQSSSWAGTRPRVAVIIPAHNEAKGIAGTIKSIGPQLNDGDRLIVVADNCSDDTAQVARDLGVIAAERTDSNRRGKGFALDHGLDQLAADPPDVVLFFDADCRITPGTIHQLAAAAKGNNRPVQSLNLCEPTAGGSAQQRISGLAFRFKNLIRMSGLARLGGPCHLTGTGMGLPWHLVSRVSWATGNVVEDMQLGIDLLSAGYPPLFVPQACVLSDLPASDSGVISQRRRWEHGFLQTALTQVPRMLGAAIKLRSWPLLLLALDLCVPPLALLSAVLLVGWVNALGLSLLDLTPLPLFLLTGAGLSFAAVTLIGWWRHCRDIAPLALLFDIPGYVFSKIPLYLDFLRRRQQQWVRAER